MSSISSTVSSSIASAAATAQQYASISPEHDQYRAIVRDQITSTLTPLNIGLVVLLITVTYYRLFKPSNAAQTLKIDKDQPVVFQTFTPRTLLKFNGQPNPPLNPNGKVYLAVKGKVHDVTGGRNFYGPGGPYENFAGRDATRGLACQSFDEDMLTKDLDGPLDDCADLGPDQLENLQGWVERFDEKVSASRSGHTQVLMFGSILWLESSLRSTRTRLMGCKIPIRDSHEISRYIELHDFAT